MKLIPIPTKKGQAKVKMKKDFLELAFNIKSSKGKSILKAREAFEKRGKSIQVVKRVSVTIPDKSLPLKS